MSLPVISVIIPTIPGREEHYAAGSSAYREQAPGNYELDLITEYDHPSVGLGWQAGADKASGDYIHLSNDDIVPRPGWHAAAIEAVERGYLPAPQVYGPQGELQSLPEWGKLGADWSPVAMTTLPFCSREQWKVITPLLTCHYYTDDWFSYRGRKGGWEAVLRTGYAFDHYWAQHRRGAGMTQDERMAHDKVLFEEAMRRDAAGEWTVPWPPEGR